MNLFDWIRLFVLSLLWGGSYIWIEYALLTVSPLTIVFFRVFMAALFLLCFCLISSKIGLLRHYLADALFCGLNYKRALKIYTSSGGASG